jgi:eukaryotic-like serine/threonine-protein kinase
MAPDRIAGRYRVERAAGQGGMGTVWLCTDEVLGRQVAVKQVGTLPGETTLDLARALREACSSAALNHRNVVSVYDAVEEGDHIWLVMEYVRGRTLAELVAEAGALSPEQAASIGAQVADGLAAAHARGTVHRDVKPGNILVSEDGVAKISDFGIARTTGDEQVTRTGMVIGTPTYFAPELARGEEPTAAVDVWALGATLYAAVEGRTPYPENPNALAMLNEIAHRPPSPPERAGFLTEPITRSLDPDPRSRWSMADLAHVLHRLDQQHASGRTRPVTASLPAVPAATAATPKAPPAPPAPAATEDEPVRERRRSRGGGLILLGLAALLVVVAVGGFLLLRDLDDDPSQGTAGTPAGSESPERESPSPRETEEDSTPAPSPSPSGTSTGEEEPEASPVAGTAAEQFVADYYSALPDDTDTGWRSLAPELQNRIGRDSYEGFWGSITDVTVTGTRPAAGGAVEVSLTYTDADGGTQSEVRRLVVDRSQGGLVIAGDAVVG